MTSSPTSSSTSTMSSSTSSPSTKLSPSLSKYNFDPFAVHPFTNCNTNNGNSTTVNHNRSNPLYAYPYRQPLGDNPTTPHTPIPSPLATTLPSHQQSSPNPYAYTPPRPTGIFVPFRQETSSPDLSDVLKPKSTSTSSMMTTTSKTHPNNTAAFIPAAPPITFSGSRKH